MGDLFELAAGAAAKAKTGTAVVKELLLVHGGGGGGISQELGLSGELSGSTLNEHVAT